MSPLLQAKYNFIDQLRTLAVHQGDVVTQFEFSSQEWRETAQGCGHRAVPLPYEEDFTLGVSYREAGAELLDFHVAHTVEVWVIRGEFDLRLGDGPWLPQRQGSTFILAPGQCHSLRVQARAYLVSTICPPLPLSLPPTAQCNG